MKLPALLVADLHLTESPSTEYRWNLFPWLKETCIEERVQTLCILGDLTDRKDNHPSELVNRIVREFQKLKEHVPRIVLLMGNHDFLKQGEMFFQFLRALPDVDVITEPTEDRDPKGMLTMFLPYSKNPCKDWKGMDFGHYELLMLHQTVKGSISSNGQEMEGEELPELNAGKVYSGDIHVPQVVGSVEYVGSPYHVHFGDNFKARAVLLEKGGRAIDLHFKSIKRVSIKAASIKALTKELVVLGKGDHVKVTIQLAEADKHEWKRLRRDALSLLETAGVEVHGVSLEVVRSGERVSVAQARASRNPEQAVLRYVEREDLTADSYDIAMEVIEK